MAERLKIDENLLRLIHELAEEQGRSEEAVMEAAVLFYAQSLRMLSEPPSLDSASIGRPIRKVHIKPRPENLGEFFSGVLRQQRERGVEPLSEDEAMELANEELHAMRRERKVSR